MKFLYYDCFSGISGDMNLGAMLDLGVDGDHLLAELKKLDIGLYDVGIRKDQRRGITGTRVDVRIPPHEAHHEPTQSGGHAGEVRTFRDIVKMIESSGLSGKVKAISLSIFTKIAQAEATVHGHSIDQVHFHEVGAVDSIVDIIGAAVCLAYLQVDGVLSSPVQVGGGFVSCAHGILPVPAPATVEILKGIPIRTGAVPFETTTPTGAAILAATVDRFTESFDFTVKAIGYGIGHRDTEIPNVLRVFLGEGSEHLLSEPVDTVDAFLIECNIDDMNPELYDDIMETLFQKGALDVFLTPVIMKKSRPAIKISILCSDRERSAIEEVLWLRTSTFGLRTNRISKTMLKRDFSIRSTKYGDITMKNAYLRGRKIKSKPEYEDCRKLAAEKGVSVKEIYDSLTSEDQ
jgi:pyridinium-3,5-bisthiocarboxylic acid mononucleotide nickel chelatase